MPGNKKTGKPEVILPGTAKEIDGDELVHSSKKEVPREADAADPDDAVHQPGIPDIAPDPEADPDDVVHDADTLDEDRV
jgi:hypothetical protein